MSVNTIILAIIAVCALLVVGSVAFVGEGVKDVTPFLPANYVKFLN